MYYNYTDKGMIDKEPHQALFKDIGEQLMLWKRENCKIVIAGDFNEDVYRGRFSKILAKDNLNMTEHILKITGVNIPPTCDRGSKAIIFLQLQGLKARPQKFSSKAYV